MIRALLVILILLTVARVVAPPVACGRYEDKPEYFYEVGGGFYSKLPNACVDWGVPDGDGLDHRALQGV